MSLKYIVICCLLQQVLSQELNDNCKFGPDELERSAVHDLHTAKEKCDEEFGQCFSEDNDNAENGKCSEEHNNCIDMILHEYEDSIKDSEYSMKLFSESLSNIDGSCNALCKYDLVFTNLVEEGVLCGLYRS
ncbi:uncharacterized protein LOC111684063 [Lucilia cuprina]|uniref:uncharacterized protein LOC111684063 n=1 Tax=Lucilia cuprina TaxID=7375 RepID=UPI001F05F4E0|nr:uncharacterized protein LOC111684063 [Lucilia cuprina]